MRYINILKLKQSHVLLLCLIFCFGFTSVVLADSRSGQTKIQNNDLFTNKTRKSTSMKKVGANSSKINTGVQLTKPTNSKALLSVGKQTQGNQAITKGIAKPSANKMSNSITKPTNINRAMKPSTSIGHKMLGSVKSVANTICNKVGHVARSVMARVGGKRTASPAIDKRAFEGQGNIDLFQSVR